MKGQYLQSSRRHIFIYKQGASCQNILSKDNTLGTGEPLKETKNMLEGENDKEIHTRIGRPVKKEDMLKDKNDKQVRTHRHKRDIGRKKMFKDKKGNRVRTYADILSTEKLSNERGR